MFLALLRLEDCANESHTFQVSGFVQNFAHPQWQAKTTGELDMRLLDPTLGYPFAPQGIAHLDLDSAGEEGEFLLTAKYMPWMPRTLAPA